MFNTFNDRFWYFRNTGKRLVPEQDRDNKPNLTYPRVGLL